MPNKSGGQGPPRDADDKSSPAQIPSTVQERIVGQGSQTAAEEDECRTGELAKEVHWLQHATFWSQVGLGLIGIAALWIYHGQLAEMQKSTQATKDALGIARDTLTETQTSNARQFTLNELARNDAATAANASSAESRRALQATIDSFHNEDRAWIGISEAKPVSFAGNATAKSANMQVAFTLRNYGHSAAENIRFLAVLESDPTITKLSCGEVDKIHGTMVLLPTQEQTLNWVMSLTPEQIAKGWLHQNPALGKILSLMIVGCMDYTDRDSEKPTHRTPFSYLVYRTHGGFIMPDTNLTGDDMALGPMFEDEGSSQVH